MSFQINTGSRYKKFRLVADAIYNSHRYILHYDISIFKRFLSYKNYLLIDELIQTNFFSYGSCNSWWITVVVKTFTYSLKRLKYYNLLFVIVLVFICIWSRSRKKILNTWVYISVMIYCHQMKRKRNQMHKISIFDTHTHTHTSLFNNLVTV